MVQVSLSLGFSSLEELRPLGGRIGHNEGVHVGGLMGL